MIIIIRALSQKKKRKKEERTKRKAQKTKKGQCYYPLTHLCFKQHHVLHIESLLSYNFHILVGIFIIELGLCYLLSIALVFPEEEGMMQQSSVSISLSFWEPRYQSSRRLRMSPSYLHKTNKSSQPTRIGVVNPYRATYESEI